ncbi:MAG: ABC transporter ATP-binding protein [Acidobacteria bacterium]|nr:ABC transporter ATP-binding protein [Acidobacteriota bacterium]
MTTTAPRPLLEVRQVSMSYGPVQVLFDVSLEVPLGSRIALLGTNGAGKSSLLKVIAGLAMPTKNHGTVQFDGHDITHLPPHERAGHGLLLVAGGQATFPTLTVQENLRLAAYPFLRDRGLVEERLGSALEMFPILGERCGQKAGTLSGGEQQMMAVARALIARPKLLMIDELSLGLAPIVMQEILRMVDEIVARGTTLLVVEQSLNVAVAITDHAYFMEKGEFRFSGPTEGLLERGDLVRSVFFGETAS